MLLLSCEEVDVVSVYVTLKDVRREIGSFCGSKLPPPLMSPNSHMELVFISRTLPDAKNYRGFKVSFSFVKGELRFPHQQFHVVSACGTRNMSVKFA